MLLAFAACSVFAKDQVLNTMDYLNSVIPTNNLSFLNKNHNQVIENAEVLNNDIEEIEVIEEETTKEIDPIQEYYDIVDEIISSENDKETKVEQLRNVLSEVMQEGEETNEELVQYISQAIMDLTINTEESQNEENNEQEVSENTNEEPIEENNEPTETIEEENAEPYTITYVNSEEEANWVLPAHCSDLTCYGEDKEFAPCTSFKMVETMDENSNRISSR